MKEPVWMKGPPGSILLATDLSARCDRALDRAVRLARAWKARLHVVHAVEEDLLEQYDAFSQRRLGRDRAETARARVEADVADEAGEIPIEIHVESADPTELVLRIAAREGCGLIVTGVARDESLGRYLLGSLVDHLIRHTPVPLLVVRGRARADYGSVIVASDFSPSSRHAIEAATRLFPDARLTLFHAYRIPFSGLGENGAIQTEFGQMGEEACEKFLADVDLPKGTAGRMKRLIERGDPELLLAEHARNHGPGLIVVGSHGGGALYEMFIGSTAAAIIREVPADILLVRDPVLTR